MGLDATLYAVKDTGYYIVGKDEDIKKTWSEVPFFGGTGTKISVVKEEVAMLPLGKASGIYDFLSEYTNLVKDNDSYLEYVIPPKKVLPQLYQLHEDCVSGKRRPGERYNGPWLNVHGEMQDIQAYLEHIIDTNTPGEQKFLHEAFEDFDWKWCISV